MHPSLRSPTLTSGVRTIALVNVLSFAKPVMLLNPFLFGDKDLDRPEAPFGLPRCCPASVGLRSSGQGLTKARTRGVVCVLTDYNKSF